MKEIMFFGAGCDTGMDLLDTVEKGDIFIVSHTKNCMLLFFSPGLLGLVNDFQPRQLLQQHLSFRLFSISEVMFLERMLTNGNQGRIFLTPQRTPKREQSLQKG